MIERDLTPTLKRFAKFPVVVLLGPRQSGKTTLARATFKNHAYVTLERPATLEYVLNDPTGFLREHENKHGIIIDEFQHAPQLLSYLQIESDEKKRPGYFVLTGSQNFLMNQAITQTLAGRAGILNLLPLSIDEFKNAALLPTLDEVLFKGCYPRIYAEDFLPEEIFPSYIHTYVERDVRQLINVENLITFQKFMQLCAGRIGQLLNILDIATQCGINRKTADEWLSLLEASYIIFLLKPYFNNFNKRVTKTPKLYFNDTGLASNLLGIRSVEHLRLSPFRGPLVESFIITELHKQYYNLGLDAPLYFWRDQNGRLEVDCLIDLGSHLVPLEIKSGATITTDYFQGIAAWSQMTSTDPEQGYIIYGGDSGQKRKSGQVMSWQAMGNLVKKLEDK